MLDMAKLKEPTPLVWLPHRNREYPNLLECWANKQMIAWLEPRPFYCDRGHWKVEINLPEECNIDGQDRFPRYYMSKTVAMAETEAFMKWRLWQIRFKEPKTKE